mmetsp:Transcript_34705/g.75957  ORF Transcript_34705/g.75957 Transcript_34705/m.75957 type:complete len:543 (-) Transcript_34705:227-1855(-)|eukprot:CAMPEP_0178501464 /NCGR_PEP_ID=MMETSP0696-20121128/16961_1 /TAXON_ID=265572 /ORGANISM="Extubocellulus spinifer, Strain CCMP396" /LENGTH=542 /DNA_ID=CAMNT_0020130409 /DNA_START=120 /DNA_END=1748 /DNA_ORIENTATION=+
MSEFHEIVVVGGGVGGLRVANRLISQGISDVVVLESRGFVGGRISTTRDADGEPMFNNFAWRVGEDTVNPKMHAICKELDIKLIPQVTPPPEDPKIGHGKCKHGVLSSLGLRKPCGGDSKETPEEPRAVPPNRAPLSDFASASLESTREADLQDRESGYAGRTAQITWPDESHGTDCFVVEGGMDAIPKAIANTLPEGCLRLNHRVSEVVKVQDGGGYEVTVVARDGNDYTTSTYKCSQVVLATPPYSLRRLSVAQDMLPALYAIHERRLGHAYVKCKPGSTYPDVPDRSDVSDRIYRKLPDSILQQIISGDYSGGIFQAAYACDRFERVWRELQYHGPETVKNEIKKQLGRITDLKIPPTGWDNTIEEVYIRIGFVHRWHIEAHVTGKTKEDLSTQAVTPNPARLPGLYLVGEAFSPFQGWTEGALWTADKAVSVIAKSRESPGGAAYEYAPATMGNHSTKIRLEKDSNDKLFVPSTPKIMMYRGLVIDVNDWYQRHPGGEGMILGHSGEDISDLFDNFHGGWPMPLATLFGLQIGCTEDV